MRVRAGEWVNDYETVRRRKDGALVPVSIAAAPVRDAAGRVVGNMVAYTDITERKAQEAEVHRLNAELHARLEELPRPGADRHRGRRRAAPASAISTTARSSGWSRLALSLRLALAKLESDPVAARTMLANAGDELSSRSTSCAARARPPSPRCSPIAGCDRRRRCSRAARRSSWRSRRSPSSGCRSPEAAAYYLIAEALTNVAKYAAASTVRVRVAATCCRAGRGVRRRRGRCRPGERVGPPRPGRPGRSTERLARRSESLRRRDLAGAEIPTLSARPRR